MFLYIHIPFCFKKCRYCSFVVYVAHQSQVNAYLECLSNEALHYKNQKFKTVYIGGGTPTCLDKNQLEKLFVTIRKNFKFDSSVEFSVEANPELLDKEKLLVMKKAGVNRVSLGVQSLNNKYLKYLGRNHDAKTARQSFELLRKYGFKNISLDLMYLFPTQTFEELKQDLKEIVNLKSDHLSLYTLTIEKNSRFFVDKEKLPSEDIQAKYYLYVKEVLNQNGFKQYEISNFAKRGKESRHNLNYWQGGDYIGLGVAAHSHINGKRYWNHSFLKNYMNAIKDKNMADEGVEILDSYQRLKEALTFGLRVNAGVDLKKLQDKYRAFFTAEDYLIINRLRKQGFLIQKKGFLKSTTKGQLVLDELCGYLI